MADLPQFIVDEYIGARISADGESWLAVRTLLFSRGRIVRGPAATFELEDGW
jgi:hypothetical protein